MVPDPCISIVVAVAEEVTAAAETARAAQKRQERKRRTRRAKGVIVFPAAAIAIAIFLRALCRTPPRRNPQSHGAKVQKERESRSFVRFKKRPGISSQISRTVQFRSTKVVGVFVKAKKWIKKRSKNDERKGGKSLRLSPSLLLHVRAKEREQSVVLITGFVARAIFA